MFHQYRNTHQRLIVDLEDVFSDKLLGHLFDHALPGELFQEFWAGLAPKMRFTLHWLCRAFCTWDLNIKRWKSSMARAHLGRLVPGF